MPGSLSQLSELRKLMLKHCKSLRSLPELPSSIETLDCDDCTSLETFSCPSTAYTLKMLERLKDPFELYQVERSGGIIFKFSNCFRIGENGQIDVLGVILQGIQLVASIPKFMYPPEVSFFTHV